MKIQYTVLVVRFFLAAVLGGSGVFCAPVRGGEAVVPVSSGAGITIFETTGKVYETAFSVSEILAGGGEFLTVAGEKYTLTSDGTYLTISCLHDRSLLEAELEDGALTERSVLSPLPFEVLLGHSAGNNIVAVRLDGVPDFPSGLWASSVVDYTLGAGGIAESRFNALGDALARGPYLDRYYTVLGAGPSSITLGFSPRLELAIEAGEIPPGGDVLPLFIKIPEGYSAGDVNFYSVELVEAAGAPVGIRPYGWWSFEDYDGDGRVDLRMEFSREEIARHLLPGENLLLIRGALYSGIAFQGRAALTVE